MASCVSFSQEDSKDEITVLYDKEATKELKLKLPSSFFLMESSPPCPGYRDSTKPAATLTKADDKGESSSGIVSFKPSPISANMTVDSSSSGSTPFMQPDSTVSGLASSPSNGFTTKPASFFCSGIVKPIFSPKKESIPGDGKRDEEQENKGPRFVPIIPDVVDLKTGEEDEETIFSHRAELLRFGTATKEWKENGVGDIKILHQREKNTDRILMRRDQEVPKLACNHWITPELVLKPLIPTSTTAWTWFAMDFAQNDELLFEHFAVHFKLEDTARLFYNKLLLCQSAMKGAVPKTSTAATAIVLAATQSAQASKISEKQEEQGEEDGEYGDTETLMLEKAALSLILRLRRRCGSCWAQATSSFR